ncbi:MAG: hemolysin III family protein [Clostridia bacterium]|nr:hemolysin III family protein [Clostridia bacterium]
MVGKDVRLIEYSKGVDTLNYLTHGVGALLSVVGAVLLLLKAEGLRETFAMVVYGLSLSAVYIVSTVYHKLKNGEAKRIARIVDHSTIPVLIAGTATPCALITLFRVSMPHGIIVFALAWICTIFGFISKIFFFEKLKAVTLGVYIACCSLMLLVAVPLLDKLNITEFLLILVGCIFYLLSIVLLGLGKKNEKFHPVFHVVVLIGSAFHYYVIYNMVN